MMSETRRQGLLILAILLLSVVDAPMAGRSSLPQANLLKSRANSFCRALEKRDVKRSYLLTLYHAKQLATLEQWSAAWGDDSGKVIKCTAGKPVELLGEDFDPLAKAFRARGIQVDSAVIMPLRFGTRDEDDADEDDDSEPSETLWLHTDKNWYFYDTSLCDPIELRPNHPLHLPAGVGCGVKSRGTFARRR